MNERKQRFVAINIHCLRHRILLRLHKGLAMKVLKNSKSISFIVSIAALLLFCGNTTIASTTWEKLVDFGDAGYSETGVVWRTYINDQSHNGSYRYLSAWEQGLKRVGTATWTTTIPYDGLYRVAVSYRQTENRSPDANYFATNSSGGLDEFVINQRGPLAYIWHTLGEYYYSAGEVVKVHLDGTDDDYSDCADAASWTLIKLGNPPPDITPILSSLLKPERVALTIIKDGPGNGTVSSFPGGIYCGSICSSDIILNTDVVLQAVSDRGSFFTGWSGSGCSGTGVCNISMTAEQAINATFSILPQYDLSVSVTGTGSVSTSPVSADGNAINCVSGPCTKPYYQNETVTLTAAEDRSSTFSEWTGNCIPTADPLEATVNMGTASKYCDAAFVTKSQHDLTVTLNGTGTGTVTSSPVSANGEAINCSAGSCTEPYWDNDTVTLTSDGDAGSHFVGWAGDADCTDGVVTMNTAKNCIATFDLEPAKQLTVTVGSCDSSYGDVSTSPGTITCSVNPSGIIGCSADFDYNSTVTLTASVAAGTFAGWEGDCTVSVDNPLVATVKMDEEKTCYALFCSIPF